MHFEQLKPDTLLFSEAGVIPSGGFWITPTDTFFRVWESPAGDDLKKRGFRMRNDGTKLGASQDLIVIYSIRRHKT